MQVKIETILNSRQELQQLLDLPLSAKTKYWVGRIANTAMSSTSEFQKEIDKMIIARGEQLIVDPATNNWRVVGVDEQLPAGAQTQWRVKPELMEEFNALAAPMAAKEVTLDFDKLSLDTFGDTPISFDITKLEWLLDIPKQSQLSVVK